VFPVGLSRDTFRSQLEESWKGAGREQPFREDLSVEAEESPLLEAVTREQLVKRQQTGKDLVCAVVMCISVEISDGAVIACSYELLCV
jgi:hypothetical protein